MQELAKVLAKLPHVTKFIHLNLSLNVSGKNVRQRTSTITILTRIYMKTMLARIVKVKIL